MLINHKCHDSELGIYIVQQMRWRLLQIVKDPAFENLTEMTGLKLKFVAK